MRLSAQRREPRLSCRQTGFGLKEQSVKGDAGRVLRDGDGFDKSPDGTDEAQAAEGNQGDAQLGDSLTCVSGVEIVNS